MTAPEQDLTLWAAAAASGALALLCALVLAHKRRELWAILRAQPLVVGAGVTLAALAVWLAHVAGRRRQPPPPHVPDRDMPLTPDARRRGPPRPAEVDHAHGLPLDTTPDPAAPLAVPPDGDLDELVRHLDQRAGQRAGSTAE